MKTNPLLSIIIVNYNTKELLKQCLSSIAQADFKSAGGIEIVIVDNGSGDGSRKYLGKLGGLGRSGRGKKSISFKIIFNKENLGFAKANNQGMRIARGNYLLLLNSDTVVKKGAINQSLLWLSSRPEYDLIGCKLLNPDGTPQPSVGRFPNLGTVFFMLFLDRISGGRAMASPAKSTPADWVMGAFMLMRREVFNKSGGFDKKFFMYMEEAEWCYRLKKMGFRIGFYPCAKIIHIGRGSSETGRSKPIVNIYRGLIIFYKKHKKNQLPILKIMLAAKAALSLWVGLVTKNEYLKKTYRQALAELS